MKRTAFNVEGLTCRDLALTLDKDGIMILKAVTASPCRAPIGSPWDGEGIMPCYNTIEEVEKIYSVVREILESLV